MRWSACFTSAAVTLLVANGADAGVVVTPALSTGTADRVVCRVLNLGPSDAKDVLLEVVSSTNAVQGSSGPSALFPGFTLSSSDTTPAAINYCRVSGKGISKSRSRLAICVADASNTPIACLQGE